MHQRKTLYSRLRRIMGGPYPHWTSFTLIILENLTNYKNAITALSTPSHLLYTRRMQLHHGPGPTGRTVTLWGLPYHTARHCLRSTSIPRPGHSRPVYIKQGLYKITRLLKFGRASNMITSKLIRHSSEAMKMEFGSNGCLFHHGPSRFEDLMSSSWMKATWIF
jgi:hypothetical protein